MEFADIVNYINTCDDDGGFVIDESEEARAETLGNEIKGYLEQMARDEFEVVEDPVTPKGNLELDLDDGNTPTVEGYDSDKDEMQYVDEDQKEDQVKDTSDDGVQIIEAFPRTSIIDGGEF